MVDGALPLGSSLRLATIVDVEKTFVVCRYLGKVAENAFECPMPQPYAGKGSGILAGVEKDAVVLVAEGPSEERFIVSFVPIRNQYFDREGIDDVPFDDDPFPEMEEGQLMLRSAGTGSYIDIHPDGDIVLDAGAGDYGADIEISGDTRSLILRTDNRYSFTEASRTVEGIIRRDKRKQEAELDTGSINFLAGEGYDSFLSTIGRLPQYKVVGSDSAGLGKTFIRNPALIEKRSITYEYADSFNVGKMSDEAIMIRGGGVDKDPGIRRNRRTDVLNLNMLNYNHLIEKVEGTLVDIYGNILDINRNKINIPDVEDLRLSEDPDKALKTMYNYMRRSVKYHFEINSRKDFFGDSPARSGNTIEQEQHSRFSLDIDAEGLTKINIPASSNTGNIPVLGRYITSRPEEDIEEWESGSYKDENEKDVRVYPFAVNGPTISNSSYSPESVSGTVTAGTAYHDLLKVADSIFSSGKWGNGARMTTSLENKMGDSESPNAGGRSLHANLDGSVEISIGADSADSKSMMLDLEGGVISHYGIDKKGRSIIHQSDGSVLMQIGSKDTGPGRLEIHLSTGGSSSQKIVIDETGMSFDVQGSIVFNASGNIGLNAGAEMMINGAHVGVFGSADTSTGAVGPGSTTILPTGHPHAGIVG